MIKISVFYPGGQDIKFDVDYYCNTHMPLVQRTLGPACKRTAVDQGLAGGAPGAPPTYAAIGHLFFDSLAEFQEVFPPHAETLMADIPNFTNAHPVVQISEIKT